MNVIIFAPHQDDEIIGCFNILDKTSEIFYFSFNNKERIKESTKLCSDFNIKHTMSFISQILNEDLYNFDDSIVYAPDPFGEHHPLHRDVGMTACLLNSMKRIKELHLYSTDMTVPWIRESRNSNAKRDLLNQYYPSQTSLWTNEHKYFLFEGDLLWPHV